MLLMSFVLRGCMSADNVCVPWSATFSCCIDNTLRCNVVELGRVFLQNMVFQSSVVAILDTVVQPDPTMMRSIRGST